MTNTNIQTALSSLLPVVLAAVEVQYPGLSNKHNLRSQSGVLAAIEELLTPKAAEPVETPRREESPSRKDSKTKSAKVAYKCAKAAIEEVDGPTSLSEALENGVSRYERDTGTNATDLGWTVLDKHLKASKADLFVRRDAEEVRNVFRKLLRKVR